MKILLTTLHAKFVHASLALPCLAAYCEQHAGILPVIREFTINEQHHRVLQAIVTEEADVVAFSCYIWNVTATMRLAAELKQVRPQTFIVLGGPEVSYTTCYLLHDNPAIDCIVCGEGETTFAELAGLLHKYDGEVPPKPLLAELSGITCRIGDEIISAPSRRLLVDLDAIPSPFTAGLVDLAKPLIYYESSRGCPFSCAFCISSLEQGVRSFSMTRIESDLLFLMEQKVGTVKLVDRTFNYDAARADAIWGYILRQNTDANFHFEIAADLLTDANIELLRRAPAGQFQFEIGVQSTLNETLDQVGRRSNLERLFRNVARLRAETGVIIHLDLVAGLPGEDLDGFEGSLQKLLDAGPHHIQVELLKVLKGAPMRQIATEQCYAFSATPPYSILRTPWLTYEEIGRIDTISRLLDLYYNSAQFTTTLRVIAAAMPLAQFFTAFAAAWEIYPELNHLRPETVAERLRAFCCTQFKGKYPEIYDALRFDLCAAEYPPASLTGFFAEGPNQNRKERITEFSRRLAIPAGSRIRIFSTSFLHNYATEPWGTEPATLTFVYVSAPQQGLTVSIFTEL